MRVQNITAQLRHFGYCTATPGGRALQPYQHGPEVSLTRIFHDQLQKDLAAGKIQISLSTQDIEFMQSMLEQGRKQAAVAPPPPPKPKPTVQKAPPKPTEPPTIKSLQELVPVDVPTIRPVGELDLAALDNLNKKASRGAPKFDKPKSTLHEIEQHLGGLV